MKTVLKILFLSFLTFFSAFGQKYQSGTRVLKGIEVLSGTPLQLDYVLENLADTAKITVNLHEGKTHLILNDGSGTWREWWYHEGRWKPKSQIIISGDEGCDKIFIEYDLSSQMDGIQQTFDIDVNITEETPLALYYSGLRLVKDVNYSINYGTHTITTYFDIPPDSLDNRKLILVAGEDVSAIESYILPVATSSVLGGIKVGSGLQITLDGVLSTTGEGACDKSVFVEYNLSSQMDGVKQTFNIDAGITEETPLALYYSGLRLVKGVNYTVDVEAHTITTLFDIPPDALGGRKLILVAGDDAAISGGTGSVTSVGLSMPGIFSVTGSPVTGSGTLAASLVSQNQSTVFAAPAAANGTPAFRTLAESDIPNLNWSKITNKPTTITGYNITDAYTKIETRTLIGDTASILRQLIKTATQVNADWNATSGAAQILNKPTIPTVNNPTVTFTQGGVNKGSITLNQSGTATIALDAVSGEGSTDFNGTLQTSATAQSKITTPTTTNTAVILHDVARTGNYNDLLNLPTIPTVNNSTVTINQGGTLKGSFTLNQSGNATINLDAGGGGTGSVTSVGLSMPNIFSVTGSPVTGSGTLTASLTSQTQATVFAAPAAANGTPTFRALTASDIPSIPWTKITGTPTIPAAQVNSDWNATSGVAQILNKPTIPTVNNPTVTINQGGVVKNTITLNQSGNATVDLHDIILFKSFKTVGNDNPPFVVGEWDGAQVKRLCHNYIWGNLQQSTTTVSIDLSSRLPSNYGVVDVRFVIGFMAQTTSLVLCKDNISQSYYASNTDYLYYKFSNGIITFYFNARGQARIDSYIIVDFK